MSARTYRVCPACAKKAEAELGRKAAAARRAYGKVRPEKYEKLLAELRDPAPLEETLAEYYSLGVDRDGTFRVTYSGGCRACTFSHEYRHEEKLKVPTKENP